MTRFDTTNALCPDCRKGYHCFGTTGGCSCRVACENTNSIPSDAEFYPGGLTPMAPKKPPTQDVKNLREQNQWLVEENRRLKKKYES
jgi:hypothetical protein